MTRIGQEEPHCSGHLACASVIHRWVSHQRRGMPAIDLQSADRRAYGAKSTHLAHAAPTCRGWQLYLKGDLFLRRQRIAIKKVLAPGSFVSVRPRGAFPYAGQEYDGIMNDQRHASLWTRVGQIWPMVVVGLGLLATIAWTALLGWLLYQVVPSLGAS